MIIFDIVIVLNFDTALADFDIYRKCNNYRNIEEYLQSLVCDCTISLEMKVGSVQFNHLKSFSTSFLGLLLVLCNSLSVFDTYYQISATHTINTPTQLVDIELIFIPIIVSKSKS